MAKPSNSLAKPTETLAKPTRKFSPRGQSNMIKHVKTLGTPEVPDSWELRCRHFTVARGLAVNWWRSYFIACQVWGVQGHWFFRIFIFQISFSLSVVERLFISVWGCFFASLITCFVLFRHCWRRCVSLGGFCCALLHRETWGITKFNFTAHSSLSSQVCYCISVWWGNNMSSNNLGCCIDWNGFLRTSDHLRIFEIIKKRCQAKIDSAHGRLGLWNVT